MCVLVSVNVCAYVYVHACVCMLVGVNICV